MSNEEDSTRKPGVACLPGRSTDNLRDIPGHVGGLLADQVGGDGSMNKGARRNEPGCACHLEEGDSPCRVRGDERIDPEANRPPLEPTVVDIPRGPSSLTRQIQILGEVLVFLGAIVAIAAVAGALGSVLYFGVRGVFGQ